MPDYESTAARPDVGALLRARNIALIGASDRVAWSRGLHRNLRASPGLRRLWLVNPSSPTAHGEPTVPALDAIDDDVDLACIVVGAGRVVDVLGAVAERRIPAAVVIASGFAEAGEEGAARSAALRDLATRAGIAVLGPNTAGMINVADGVWPMATGMVAPDSSGPLVIAAQSGGVANQLYRTSQARGIGTRAVYGVGNELVIGAVDVVRQHLSDDDVRVVALYLEGIGDPQAFVDVAVEAAEAGKALVVMKVGRSERGRSMIASHTGAMVGDDQVIDLALRELGVIRVNTLDELVATAGLLSHGPAVRGRRVAAISGSGATCAMMADEAARNGIELVDLAPATKEALAAVLPEGVAASNPLDATGAVVGDPRLASNAVVAVAEDPNVDVVLCQSLIAERFDADQESFMAERAVGMAEAVAATAKPIVFQTDITTDLSPEQRAVLSDAGLYVSRGIDLTMNAIAASARWAAAALNVRRPAPPRNERAGEHPVLMGQAESVQRLGRFSVPVLPSVLATDPSAAVGAARRLGYPVVAKLDADGIAHKSDIGGVELGLRDDEQVRTAFDRIVAKASAALDSDAINGVLIEPMREGGVELVVSVDDVAPWGTMLTVGLGGIWVEMLEDVASRLLPVAHAEVVEMLQSLRGRALLEGGRGSKPANLQRVADAVLAVVAAADELGSRLYGIEINPLLVDGDEVCVLDALIFTRAEA